MVWSRSACKQCFTLLRCTLSFFFCCFCSPNILIHSTALFLIRAFKFDHDLNPSNWHFWWKTRGSKIQRSALPCAGGGHDSLSSECCNYKQVPFAHSLHQKKNKLWIEWKLARRNYHTSVWSRASYRGDYSPLFILPHSPPCLWITFNLQSKQLWQGLWSFDERQREAGRKWVWGNEAAMSRNDLWTAPSVTLPSPRCSQPRVSHLSKKFNSDHAQSDQRTISRNWIALFV